MQTAEGSISNHRPRCRLHLQQSLSLQDWAVQPQQALQLNHRLILGIYSIVFRDRKMPTTCCLGALTHIARFFLLHDFFTLDPLLSHDFCLEFVTKNAACVNGTIEITLEQIQCDIAANLQRQNCGEFALCVSRHLQVFVTV